MDHPLFAKLKSLVDEAQSLNDKPKDADLKLSVFQVSLFDEFDELAEGIDGADLFIGRMRSLLRVAEGEEAQVPDTLSRSALTRLRDSSGSRVCIKADLAGSSPMIWV